MRGTVMPSACYCMHCAGAMPASACLGLALLPQALKLIDRKKNIFKLSQGARACGVGRGAAGWLTMDTAPIPKEEPRH